MREAQVGQGQGQGQVSEQETRRRAIARALANGGARAVRRLAYGRYVVGSASRPGVQHRVSQDGSGHFHCSCPAGVSGRACWHTAAVYVAKVEHGGARVTGPSTPLPAAIPTNVVALPQRRAA